MTRIVDEPVQGQPVSSADLPVEVEDIEDQAAQEVVASLTTSKEQQQQQQREALQEFGRPVPLRKFFAFASLGEVLLFGVGVLAALAHGTTQPFMCVLFGNLINALAEDPGSDAFLDDVNSITLQFSLLGVGVLLVGAVQNFLFNYIVDKQVGRMRPLYFRALLNRDVAWFDTHDVGSLPGNLDEDLDVYRDGIGKKFGISIMSVSTLLSGYVIALVLSWQVALVTTAALPVLAIGALAIGSAVVDVQQERQGAYARAASLVDEVLYAVRTVVAFGSERRELARYSDSVEEARRGGVFARAKMGAGIGYMFAVFIASIALAFYVGMRLVVSGTELSIGNLLSALFCVVTAGLQIGQIPPGLADLSQARLNMARFFHIVENQGEIQKHLSDDGETCAPIDTLELQDVHFSYPTRPSVQVLRGVNLLIKKGQKVAVVGESGSGKSTIMALLERFYDPSAGAVLVNGADLRRFSVASFRSHIGYVGQEPVLFATSVQNNIMQGCSSATKEDLQRVAQQARLDFVDKLPERFGTFVGSGGSQFSGGQKQRIAIARALLKRPSVLFLDEATSALDSTSEKMIQDTLDSIGDDSELGMTIVSIAHRLSTVRNSDVIYVMKEGVVAEYGSHVELQARPGGIYQALAATQAVPLKVETGSTPKEEQPVQPMLTKQASHELAVQPMFTRQASLASKANPVANAISVISGGGRAHSSAEEREDLRQQHISKEYRVPMTRLLRFCRPEWWAFIPGVMGALISGATWPITFAYVQVDAMTSFISYSQFPAAHNILRDEIEKACTLIVLIAAARFVGTFLQYLCFAVLGEAMTKRCRVAMLTSMFRQELGFHDNPENTPSRLVKSLQIYAYRISTLCISIGDTADAVSSVAVGLTVAFVGEWRMALLMLLALPIMCVAQMVEIAFTMGGLKKESKALKEASQVVGDSLNGARTVHAAGNEQGVVELYTSLVQLDVGNLFKTHMVGALVYGFSKGCTFWVSAGGFYIMGWLISEGLSDFTGTTRAFMGVLYAGIGAGTAFGLSGDVGKAKVAAHDMFELLDRKSAINGLESTGHSLAEDAQVGRMEFSSVQFFYPFRPEVKVLKELSFTVEAGQSVGLVGPSGGGKSTVLSMIQRFYDPQAGRVLVGSARVPLTQVDVRWWRKQVGFVGQEPILFDGTVLENVQYGLEDGQSAPNERLEEVKRMANLSFLDGRKGQGWQTRVGARGSRLSGGQKQRVAIARALVRDPPILLLDEATSALDSSSEKIVAQALREARQGRTSFAIAHRLSTVQDCDLILVVADGRLAESGNHTELMRLDGVYAKLQAQSGVA